MRKILRVLGILVLSIVLLLLLVIAYVKIALPDVGPAPQMTIEKTEARVARGTYLARSVMACMDCHSQRNLTQYTMPLIPGTLGQGGERFDQTMGFPGVYYAANITPAGVGDWTDGELYRAITTGVRKNGKPIFPVMPYHSYGTADPEDVKSIIVFVRSLPPLQNKVPESSSDFPMNIILNTIPVKANPVSIPPVSDSVAYGKYVFTIAACYDCHTKLDKGKFIEKMAMAGGRSFPVPGGTVNSANITPDSLTGIGTWTKDFFVRHFAMYRDSAQAHRTMAKGDIQTIMPWTLYGTMKDEDLGAIYTYLRSLAPISNKVVKWKAAP